jgi:hypothetical protein
MGKPKRRFVAKAEAGEGWRIWDNRIRRWWGQRYLNYPEALLTELNGDKRPEHLTDLAKKTARIPR